MRSLLLTLLLLCAPALAEFQPLDFDTARAKAGKRWVLVDVTATWCGPCRQMEKTTWVDPDVRQWLQANAVAIRLDADKNKELLKSWRVMSLPAVLLFKDGVEAGRVTGFQNAEELLAWLQLVEAGGDSLAALRRKWEVDQIENRGELASALLQKQHYEEALEHYLWLWEHMKGTSWEGVRATSLMGEIATLCREYPAASERFAQLREQLKNDPERAYDWILLEQRLGDEENVIARYGKSRPIPQEARPPMFQLLVERQAWADAGTVFPDPLSWARELLENWKSVEEEEPAFAGLGRRLVASTLAPLHKALQAASRSEEARDLRDLVRQYYPDLDF